MKTKKWLSFLLTLVMVLGLLPVTAVTALAANDFTINLSSNDENAGAVFSVSFLDDDTLDPIDDIEGIETDEGGEFSRTVSRSTLEEYQCFFLDVQLKKYNKDEYDLAKIIINEIEYSGGDLETHYNSRRDYYYFVYESFEDFEETFGGYSFTLQAVFAPKGGNVYATATVNLAPNEDKGTIESMIGLDDDSGASTAWTLTSAPAAGYQLAYLEPDGDGTRVYSEDGKTATWTISEDTTYMVVFETVTMHYVKDSFYYRPLRFSSGTGHPSSTKPVSVGQRVGFGFNVAMPTRIPGGLGDYNTYTYKLYPGTDTSAAATPLAQFERAMEGTSESFSQIVLTVDPLPAGLEQVTITMQINDGAVVTAGPFDITARDSGRMEDLRYFTSPIDSSGTLYPTDVGARDKGPHVYDIAAFTDEATGALELYFAVSGGVMQYTSTGTGDLIYMEGMAFPYNDNFDNSGFAFAIGGEDSTQLYAIVKAASGNFYDGVVHDFCIYKCTDQVWSKVPGSSFEVPNGKYDDYTFGLVMNEADMWTSAQHWNGSEWLPNDLTFNSFWKESASSAYAGSAAGLYHYDGSDWTLVDNTSGLDVTVSSAARNADGSVSIVSGAASLLTVKNNTATTSAIDTSGIIGGNPDSEKVFIGIDEDGALYGFTGARLYYEATSGYTGTYVYKQDGTSWIHQIVDEFNDPNEDSDDLDHKIRPDGVTRILNPAEGVSFFLGASGAIYAKLGSATISFDSNGGSAVSPITQTIGSAVTPPAAPTRDGFTFAGWYLSNRDIAMGNAPYNWSVMPAANITLYAKWRENGSSGGSSTTDPFENEKTQAKKSLATTVARLAQSDYEADVWSQITAAKTAGDSAIDAATTYNGVYDALNTAVEKINALSQNTSGTITVAVTVEKFTIDGEYIIEPTLVTTKKYAQASIVITDLLKEVFAGDMPIPRGSNGNPYTMTGSETSNFYLSGIWTGTDFLSEFDGGPQSGWMYCVKGSFPGVGASGWTLLNGDVMRWQYTCEGLGNDIGSDNSAWGDNNAVSVANKDALIWKIAEINQAGTKADFGDAYDEAMTVLKTITATQAEVDAALAALSGGSSGAGGSGTGGSTKPAETTGTEADVTVEAEVVNGEAKAEVSEEAVAEALKEAEDTLTVKVESKDADSVEAALSADAVQAAANADVDLHVDTEVGTVKVDSDTLGELAESGKDVAVTVTENADGTITVDVTAGGETVDASVKVELPAAEAGQVLVIVNADGTETVVKKSVVEGDTVYAEIPAGATVKVVEKDASYGDVKAGDWFAEDVEFVTTHGLFEGTNKGFEPTAPMTRAMLATVLYRLEDAIASGSNVFADVANGTWYTEAAIWTGSTGIIEGTDKGFEPNENVTREQIATILFRYANYIGLDTSARASLSAFPDGGETASWAKDAMSWAVAVGIFEGSDTGLNPGGDATRAQVAALFTRMVKLIVK